MLAKLNTFALVGIEAVPIDVEVDVSPAGLPKTVLVGLAEAAVKESTHRVERAIVNSGFQLPGNRVVINLAPADLPKDASSFDLPIALGMLAATGQFASERLANCVVTGELALDGVTRPTKGALSMAMAAGERDRLWGMLVPRDSADEAAVVEEVAVYPISSLSQAAMLAADRDRPGPLARRATVRQARAVRGRLRRRPRPGDGQAGPHRRSGRGAQPDDDRPARLGQDDAGQTCSQHITPTDSRRVD